MEVLRTVAELRAARASMGSRPPTPDPPGRIALVPTMGALHEGHLSLVRAAHRRAETVVASLFVNPLQFGPREDFASYPRDFDRDLALLRAEGTDAVFAPEVAVFTPPDLRTSVHVAGLSEVLEGASRPGHLDGVATVVTKLLSAVRPDVALFGEKDYQQLLVIQRLAADLDLGVEIVGCPIVREPDGLAMSSRNAYLSPDERAQATVLSRALFAAAAGWGGDADRARKVLLTTLSGAPAIRLDYAEVADPETLAPLEGVVTGPARALIAASVGRTRLIDNLRLEPS